MMRHNREDCPYCYLGGETVYLYTLFHREYLYGAFQVGPDGANIFHAPFENFCKVYSLDEIELQDGDRFRDNLNYEMDAD